MDKYYYPKLPRILSLAKSHEEFTVTTEIRQFTSIKDIVDYVSNQIAQQKALFDDYSQWLGTLLRDFEKDHKNDEWYQKTAAIQKTLKNKSKQPAPKSSKDKKAKGKGENESIWVYSGDLQISFADEAQTQILFEAIEKIKIKTQEFENFKAAVQQLARLGLGSSVNYLIYVEDDAPKKIVLKSKGGDKTDEAFKFASEFTVPAYYEQ
jgi:hypothetical protein